MSPRRRVGRWPGTPPATLLELIQRGPDTWKRDARRAGCQRRRTAGATPPVDDPLARADSAPAKNIFCLGLNYASHAWNRRTRPRPDRRFQQNPVFFTKAPTT